MLNQNGSWVLFTISRNSVYQSLLYQDLSVTALMEKTAKVNLILRQVTFLKGVIHVDGYNQFFCFFAVNKGKNIH